MKILFSFLIILLSTAAFAANLYTIELNFDGSSVKGAARWKSEEAAEFKTSLKVSGADVQGGSFTLPAGAGSFTFEGTPSSVFGEWFPVTSAPADYLVTVTLPSGYIPVFEGRESASAGGVVYTFRSRGGIESPKLIISEGLTEKSKVQDGVKIRTLFSGRNAAFASAYLEKSAEYINMYSEMIGKYPYESFTVAEVPYPVGYAFQGFTSLGADVIPLPFITETSLGHEILHQWFGSQVEIDYDKGNWSEGITSYLADYYYEEIKWQGKEYRKNSLVGFAAYSDNSTDFPMTEFRSRHGKEGAVVGYNKSMMFFHMLKRTYGKDKFLEAVRLFVQENTGKKASWGDWKSVFSRVAGVESEKLFDTWITSKGLPAYKASKISVKAENGAYVTSFSLERSGGDFIASVPVLIKTATGKEDFIIYSDNESKSVELMTDTEPMSLVIDPYYDVPRILSDVETPAVLSAYLGSTKKAAVIGDKAFDCLGALSTQGGVKAVSPEGFKLEDYKDYSVLFAGVDDGFYPQYFGRAPEAETGLQVKTVKNPFGEGKVIVTVRGEADGIEGVCRRLEFYGKYSELVFVKGRNVKKEIERTENGIVYEIKDKRYGFRVKDALKLTDIVEEAGKARLFYIGERHDQYAHHANQLALIKLLHEKHGKIAIGLEMFQRPFQQALDDYTSGLIDERTMLERTEYFKRWRFDYHLYKPILTYARKHNIRVIAMNAPAEATKKIAEGGLVNLTDEERAHTSKEIDYTKDDYRNDLKFIFDMHPSRQVFSNFLEAQLTWDETMAEAVAEYIENNDGIMVVLAGSGHIRRGYGIPDRVKRRNGLEYVSIVQDEDAERGIADYVLFPGSLRGAEAPKLGVMIKTDEGKVEVTAVTEGGAGERAELKAGDVITGLAGFEIKEFEDLRLALFYMKEGTIVSLTILRDGMEKVIETEL